MRTLLVLLAFVLPAWGQVVIEDFKCQLPQSATSGNPTLVTCADGHGFGNARASGVLAGAPSSGDTVTVNGATYRFVSDLSGCAPNDIKLAAPGDYNGSAQAWINSGGHLAAAMNGDAAGMAWDGVRWRRMPMAGTQYCAGTVPNPDVSASIGFSTSGAFVYVLARVPGPSGQFDVSQTSSSMKWRDRDRTTASTKLKIQWAVRIIGATDGWAGINNALRVATYVDDNTYSVAFNSSNAGDFAAQAWVARRAAFDGTLFVYHNSNDLPGPLEVPQNGSLDIYVYGCTASDTELDCARSFVTPDNQKNYGARAPIRSFVVSGGVATVSLGAWINANMGVPFEAGNRFFLRGFQKYYKATPITAATQMGGGVTVTASAHGCVDGDQAVIVPPSSFSGVWPISNPTATTVNLVGATLATAYAGGERITCNPEGRAAQAEAGHFTAKAAGGLLSKAPKLTTVSGATFTFDTLLSDGAYTGTLEARLQGLTAPYLYVYPRTTQSGSAWYAPNDMLMFHAKSGTPLPNSNRIRLWVNWGPTAKRFDNAKYTLNLGTYATPSLEGANARSHFYHYLAPNIYGGRWVQIEANSAPSHQVGALGGSLYPENPTARHAYAPAWAGGRADWNYSEGQNLVYLDTGGLGRFEDAQNFGNTTTSYGRIEMDYAGDEPEEWVRTRASVYSPNRYTGGPLAGDGGYEIAWDGTAGGPAVTYQVRYSTAESLKTAGWSTGTDGGSVSEPGQGLDYGGALWQSPTMEEGDGFWAAIRPVMPIMGAAQSGQPSWLVFRSHSGMRAGDRVTVRGAGGSRDVLDEAIAEVVSHRYWFADQPPTDETPYWTVGGGRLSSIVAAGSVCTASFTEAHGLLPGWVIEVVGSTNSTLGLAGGNWWNTRRYTIASIPATQRLTFSCPGVPNGTYSTSASGYRMVVHALPGVRLTATAAGGWTGGGTMISTEENKNFAEVYLPRYEITGTPPASPCSLSASAVDSTRIQLDWQDCSNNETQFLIERSNGTGDPFQQVATVGPNTTSYVNSNLEAATLYTYRMISRNAHGSSAPSMEASAQTQGSPVPPEAPDGLLVRAAGSSEVILAWTDHSNSELGFRVEVDSGLGFQEWVVVGPNTTEYAVTPLQPETSYQFRVRAFNAQGASDYSNEVTATTKQPMSARLGGVALSHAALLTYYPSGGGSCQWSLWDSLGVETTGSDSGGPGSRTLAWSNLTSAHPYLWQMRCGTAAEAGQFQTKPEGVSSPVTLRVAAWRPSGQADNLLLEYGTALNQLTGRVSSACTQPLCTAEFPATGNGIVWVMRRWCSNQSSDPNCTNPANELTRSEPEALANP